MAVPVPPIFFSKYLYFIFNKPLVESTKTSFLFSASYVYSIPKTASYYDKQIQLIYLNKLF